MFKWTVSQTVVSQASHQDIWNVWKNVKGWPDWDTHLEWSKLEGDFTLHAKGSLKPQGMKVHHFTICELTQDKSFTTSSPLFLTSMLFGHEIKQVNPSLIAVTHSATVSGFLAPLLYMVMRKNIQKGFKEALPKLVAIAEQQSSTGDNA